MKSLKIIAEFFGILFLISFAPYSGEFGEDIAFLALVSLLVVGGYFIHRCSGRKGTKSLSLTEDQAEPVSGKNQT